MMAYPRVIGAAWQVAQARSRDQSLMTCNPRSFCTADMFLACLQRARQDTITHMITHEIIGISRKAFGKTRVATISVDTSTSHIISEIDHLESRKGSLLDTL